MIRHARLVARSLCAAALVIGGLGPGSAFAQPAGTGEPTAEVAPAATDSSDPSTGWADARWTLSVGVDALLDGNAGGERVTLYGARAGVALWLYPELGFRFDYLGAGARRGVDETFTVQLHHYATVSVEGRWLLSDVAALSASVGGGVKAEQHGHHSASNAIWAHIVDPVLAMTLSFDALARGFGLRFHLDGWVAPDGLDVGAGVAFLIPL